MSVSIESAFNLPAAEGPVLPAIAATGAVSALTDRLDQASPSGALIFPDFVNPQHLKAEIHAVAIEIRKLRLLTGKTGRLKMAQCIGSLYAACDQLGLSIDRLDQQGHSSIDLELRYIDVLIQLNDLNQQI
jgi:hypothetical protein